MRLVALERFAEPSRRCDPELTADPGDVVEAWELHRPAADRRGPVGEAVSAAWAWARVPLGPRARWRLLRACWSMTPHRVAALATVPRWIRALRADPPDAVVCFTARHFPVAPLAAEAAGVPCREVLASATQYLGEFAFELFAVLPYAHWLHQQGRLAWTASTADTAALYFFSPRHVERAVDRRYVQITEYPVGQPGAREYDHLGGMPSHLTTDQWSPPDLRSQYRDDRFRFEKPTAVICNKASDERYFGAGFVVNHLDNDLLLRVVERLVPHFTVVYDRPRASDIVNDHSEVREMGDIEAVQAAHPEVLTIQDLHARHPELGFNELQLRVFAGCEAFVSVLGGASYLASYFGGTNIVLAQRGFEVDDGAYRWFPALSGARVVAVASPAALLEAIDRELVGATAPPITGRPG